MILSKKIGIILFLFFMNSPLDAMNRSEPMAPDSSISRPDSLDADEHEQIMEANGASEQKLKYASIGIAVLGAMFSTSVISRLLRFKPLVLAGITAIGYLIYQVEKRNNYWGARYLMRNAPYYWRLLVQRLNAYPTSQRGQAAMNSNEIRNELESLRAMYAIISAEAARGQYQIDDSAMAKLQSDIAMREQQLGSINNQRQVPQQSNHHRSKRKRVKEPAHLPAAHANENISDSARGHALDAGESQNFKTMFDAAIKERNIESLRSCFAAGARLHNVSDQYREYVRALNADPRDTQKEQRTKQEIMHLFADAGLQESECPFCLESLNGLNHDGSWARDLAVYECGHIYCLNCYKTLISNNKLCPTCQQV